MTRAPLQSGRAVTGWFAQGFSRTMGQWRSQVRRLRWSNYRDKTYWAWVPGVMVLVRVAVGAFHLSKLALMAVAAVVALYFIFGWLMVALLATLTWAGVQAVTRVRAGAAG